MDMTHYGRQGQGPHSPNKPGNESIGDLEDNNALLSRLKEAISEDNPAAVMCIKAAINDSSADQWEKIYNQLESWHKAYLQKRSQQHSDELHELQELVKRNLALERRLLDEQLANHRGALMDSCIGAGDRSQDQSGLMRSDSHGAASSSLWAMQHPASEGTHAAATPEGRRNLCDHLTEVATICPIPAPATPEEVTRLRAALALAEGRLARSRRQSDALLRRLAAAEGELEFLRNRGRNRRQSEGGARPLQGDPADPGSCLRQSLAELERRQLIDPLELRDAEAAAAAEAPPSITDPEHIERRYDCLQAERRDVEAALSRVPRPGSQHHSWHSARDRELLEKRLDSIDRELVHLRNSLQLFQLI